MLSLDRGAKSKATCTTMPTCSPHAQLFLEWIRLVDCWATTAFAIRFAVFSDCRINGCRRTRDRITAPDANCQTAVSIVRRHLPSLDPNPASPFPPFLLACTYLSYLSPSALLHALHFSWLHSWLPIWWRCESVDYLRWALGCLTDII